MDIFFNFRLNPNRVNHGGIYQKKVIFDRVILGGVIFSGIWTEEKTRKMLQRKLRA